METIQTLSLHLETYCTSSKNQYSGENQFNHSVNCTRYMIGYTVFCLFNTRTYTIHNFLKYTRNYTIIKVSSDAEFMPALFKKLILEILAIPGSSGAVERLFSQSNIRCRKQKKPYVTKKLGNFGSNCCL